MDEIRVPSRLHRDLDCGGSAIFRSHTGPAACSVGRCCRRGVSGTWLGLSYKWINEEISVSEFLKDQRAPASLRLLSQEEGVGGSGGLGPGLWRHAHQRLRHGH